MTQAYGYYRMRRLKTLLTREKIEEDAARQAMEPLLLAERDREFLKELRKQRDFEKQLMSDVKGWEVSRANTLCSDEGRFDVTFFCRLAPGSASPCSPHSRTTPCCSGVSPERISTPCPGPTTTRWRKTTGKAWSDPCDRRHLKKGLRTVIVKSVASGSGAC